VRKALLLKELNPPRPRMVYQEHILGSADLIPKGEFSCVVHTCKGCGAVEYTLGSFLPKFVLVATPDAHSWFKKVLQ
jgi:hypothetical protein